MDRLRSFQAVMYSVTPAPDRSPQATFSSLTALIFSRLVVHQTRTAMPHSLHVCSFFQPGRSCSQTAPTMSSCTREREVTIQLGRLKSEQLLERSLPETHM